ncbi:methyltransferase regulatory domain-containing protein [Pectobacterium cacticida]|uniref:methyltransferase regulatory domain-containing protein n=1 Tax=Pectobacterium cacticida TaxID=69221 RepID=UPI003985BE6C
MNTFSSSSNIPADESVAENVAQQNKEIAEAYDRQLYESAAFSFSSPLHLRAAAHLYGLDSVPLIKARVLELGCAGGGNLLPFALAYPEAQVVGVDLSTVQIEQGKELVQELGVHNLHLHAMSLTDISPEFGQFDYIIAHGVFSWIPPEVRTAMLRVMRENLSPNGIAYISYNTYPGWKVGDIIRDAMLMHSHGIHDDVNRLASAKAMLDLFSDGIAHNNALAPALGGMVKFLRGMSDHYITHEYLETFNAPCYLLEFADLVQQQGMEHVGDAEPQLELSATFGQNVQLNHSLIAMGQPRILRQQYLDFAVGRNFRKSIIVHQARAEQILVKPDIERLVDLRYAGYFEKTESKGEFHYFITHNGRDLVTKDPAILAIINALTDAWPDTLDFASLLNQAKTLLQVENDDDAHSDVLTALQTLFRLNRLVYSIEGSPYDGYNKQAALVRPKLISSLAHMIEKRKNKSFGITPHNLWHETVNLKLKEAEQFLLPFINGSYTQVQLRTKLRDALNQGIVPGIDGNYLKGQRNLDSVAGEIVQNLLNLLHKVAVLHK